jgi:hypothetical protein
MRMRQLLRQQHGMTLLMAVGILGALSLSGTTLVYYSSSNGRSAEYSNDSANAYDLAEAGINEMMAVLSKPENNALDKYLLGYQPNGSIVKTVHEYDGGTVEWWGTLDEAAATWTITSLGRMRNPTGAARDVQRTLSAKVPVTPTLTQPLNNPAWNYIMSTQVTGGECDMTIGNTVAVRSNLYVFGNLCLDNQGTVQNGAMYDTLLVVKGKVTQKTQHNTIGTSGDPLGEAHVANGCKWFNNAFHSPCQPGAGSSGNDNLFAGLFSSEPVSLAAPDADFDAWYLNGSPGPYFPCFTKSGTPPVFDSPVADATASDEEKLAYKNNSQSTAFNLTGSSSYSCKTAGGELTYDATNKVLTVSGTIYVDGDLRAEHAAMTLVRYDGQGTIYLSGTLSIKNTKLCGGVLGSECDFDAWDPNTEMLTFVTQSHNRQPNVESGVGIQLKNAQLQGALYAEYAVKLDTDSLVDGPMVGSEVILGQKTSTNDFPTITTVPAGMPGNPAVYAQPNPPQLYSG